MKSYLSKVELDALSKLIGSTLNFTGGPDLWAKLSATKVVLSTSKADIYFTGSIFYSSFEGFEDNYSKLNLNYADAKTIDRSRKNNFI